MTTTTDREPPSTANRVDRANKHRGGAQRARPNQTTTSGGAQWARPKRTATNGPDRTTVGTPCSTADVHAALLLRTLLLVDVADGVRGVLILPAPPRKMVRTTSRLANRGVAAPPEVGCVLARIPCSAEMGAAAARATTPSGGGSVANGRSLARTAGGGDSEEGAAKGARKVAACDETAAAAAVSPTVAAPRAN